jgi:hypothetical protein
MNATRLAGALLVACTAALACSGPAGTTRTGHTLYVTAAASSLVDRGLAAAAPNDADAAGFHTVPSPGVQYRPNTAQATSAPWVDSNGWRFQRGVRKASYRTLSAGAASLAAAEAFTYGVDAILNPDRSDVEALGRMLTFLRAQEQLSLPVMANIGIVDDRSPLMGEALNMLTRRNLLYRVVMAPDPNLDLTVRLGTKEFPTAAAANPSDLAARVRAKLGDDNRLVRIYGSSTVIAYLVGDGARARLHFLAYGGRRRQQGRTQEGLRIRLLGRYRPVKVAAYGAPQDARLADVDNLDDATEFSLPAFDTYALVDLEAMR